PGRIVPPGGARQGRHAHRGESLRERDHSPVHGQPARAVGAGAEEAGGSGEGATAMKKWFALSAIGRDRPGIVADLAELIYECDCNLEDSSMTILGSEFAVLLLLSGEAPDLERRLATGCKRLEWEKRLTVFFRPLDGDPS